MNLVYTLAAERDIAALIRRVEKDNRRAAIRLALRIRRSIARLEILPFSAPRRRFGGHRILVIPGTRYFVIYRVSEDTVEILRIYHSARNILR